MVSGTTVPTILPWTGACVKRYQPRINICIFFLTSYFWMLITWDTAANERSLSFSAHLLKVSVLSNASVGTVLRMLIHRSQSICDHAHKCGLTTISVPERLYWTGCSISLNPHSSFTVSNFFANHTSRVSSHPFNPNPKKYLETGIFVFKCVRCVLEANAKYFVMQRIVIQISMHELNSTREREKFLRFWPYWCNSICIRRLPKHS